MIAAVAFLLGFGFALGMAVLLAWAGSGDLEGR